MEETATRERTTRRFRVFRMKRGDPAPHFDEFTVPVGPRTTVLESLRHIRIHRDWTLTLRHSCFHASCGTCAMRVNGREVLTCVTPVADLDGGPIVVEPIANASVVSDLVVDMADFFERFTPAGRPLVRAGELVDGAETPEGIEGYTRLEDCIECGLCLSACPIVATDPLYLGPAALAAARRVHEEPRGVDPAQVLAWANHEQGVWRCHLSFECTEVCPSNVDPAGAIMALRAKLTRRSIRRLLPGARGAG